MDQAERERRWALASAHTAGISIRSLATAAKLSASRVHQLVVAADVCVTWRRVTLLVMASRRHRYGSSSLRHARAVTAGRAEGTVLNVPGETPEINAEWSYDVALSFAGEQRTYVAEVAEALRGRGIRPFYDDYEKVTLWGKDLYEHLDWVYGKAARYCVLFASADYERKVWTTYERRSAQARALESKQEYVLPARFDDTEIPGLRPTVHYVDLRRTPPHELAAMIALKLGPRPPRRYFPPQPDNLFTALGAKSKRDRAAVAGIAPPSWRRWPG